MTTSDWGDWLPRAAVVSAFVAVAAGLLGWYVQVAYETDLAFARETMAEEADRLLGEEMEPRVRRYRSRLSETAVELSVDDRPTVDVVLQESWVELRLRYLVDPRRATRTRNLLYERVIDRFAAEPERVTLPVGRNR